MEAIITGIDTVVTMTSQVFTLITGNALLAIFMAAGLLGTGIRIFSRLRRVAK